jgi:hypothetical protein
VKANERLFASLPHIRDAKLKSETSAPYSEEDSTHVLGYVTRFDFRLPAKADAWSFFTGRLRPDWLWVETIDGPVLNFRRGKAFVSINLESRRAHLLELGSTTPTTASSADAALQAAAPVRLRGARSGARSSPARSRPSVRPTPVM